jgi:hypothetical protein
MAAALRINYNTVRAAYQELERQGYLITEQGRGTFVSSKLPSQPADRQAALLDLIDEALLKARSLGVSAETFARTAYARAKLAAPGEGQAIRLLFSECNWPDLEYHAQTIQVGTGLQPEIFLVDDLRERDPAFFDQFDLLVTTMFHVAELQEIVGPERTVLGLMVEPSYLEVISEISRLSRGTRVGLVCASQVGAERMARALRGVGMNHLEFLTAGVDRPTQLTDLFEQAERVYISRIGLSEADRPWPEGKPVREYVDDIDPSALRLLRRQIAQLGTRL